MVYEKNVRVIDYDDSCLVSRNVKLTSSSDWVCQFQAMPRVRLWYARVVVRILKTSKIHVYMRSKRL